MLRRFLVLAIALAPVLATATPAHASTILGGKFHSLPPARVLDTRDGTGLGPFCAQGAPMPLGNDASLSVPIVGCGGVPATGATGVVLTVTVTDTTSDGYLTVWPSSVTRPTASNLNWTAGQTVSNLVVVGLGRGGAVEAYNHSGAADVIFDVAGWISDPTDLAVGGGFVPLQPLRLLDTRKGQQLLEGEEFPLLIAGRAVLPNDGRSTAAVVNVTVTNAQAPGYLTLWPTGSPRPLASSINFVPGQTVATRAIVQLGTSGSGMGRVSIWSPVDVDVIVDLNGWFTSNSAATGGARYVPVTPTRFLDTRTDFMGGGLNAGHAAVLQIAGQNGIPSMDDIGGPGAVVANVTVTQNASAGYSSIWPDGTSWPGTSDINFAAGQTVPNLVVVKLSDQGAIRILNQGGCGHVVVDVVGWFTGDPTGLSPVQSAVPACPPPPAPPPTHISIPKISVDTAVESVGLDQTGQAPAGPANVQDVGWYQDSPVPGRPGHAIIDGHVDWYTGPAVFINLSSLKPGDDIYVTNAVGTVQHWVTQSVAAYPADYFPPDLYDDSSPPQLWLITCTGTYTPSTGYSARLVVVATPA